MANERKTKTKTPEKAEAIKLKTKLTESKKQENQYSCAYNIENPDLEFIANNGAIKSNRKNRVCVFENFIEQNGYTKFTQVNEKNNGNPNSKVRPKLNISKHKTVTSQVKKCNKLPKRTKKIKKNQTNSSNNISESHQEMMKFTKAEAKQNYSKLIRIPSKYNMDSNLDAYACDSNDSDVTQELASDESMCYINFRNMKNMMCEGHFNDSTETTDSNLDPCWYKEKLYENVHDNDSDSQYNDYSHINDYSAVDEELIQHFQSSGENNTDYKLPQYIPEDLIIHKGTAKKRDCTLSDDVQFNSDADEAQIIELREQDTFKTILQPHAYNKGELEKLVFRANETFRHSITKALNTRSDRPLLDLTNSNFNNSLNSQNVSNYSMNVNTGSIEPVCNLKHQERPLATNSQKVNLLFETDDDGFNFNKYLQEFQTEVIDDLRCCYVEIANSQMNLNTYNDVKNTENNDEYQPPSKPLTENIDLSDKSSVLLANVVNYDESQMISENEDDFDENSFSSVCSDFDFCTEVAQFEYTRATVPNTSHVEDETMININHSLFLNEEKINLDDMSKTIYSKNTESVKCYTESSQNINTRSTKFFAAILGNMVIAVLKKPFCIYGTLRLTLIYGALQVYGHSPNLNEEVEIFSPRGCCTVMVSAQPSTASKDWQACLQPYKTYFSAQDFKEIKRRFKVGKDALVILKPNHSSKRVQQQFQKFMDQNIFPTLQGLSINRPLYNIEYKLNCILNTIAPKENCLRVPQIWQKFKVTQHSKIMMTGGKSVGKSTLLRFLLNKYITLYPRILLIDLDIGQPEIFVPETISCTVLTKPLVGPGFLFNLQPDKAFAVGHVDILLCSPTYVQATKKLIAYCLNQEKYKDIPWLINTMGYNRGFALELMTVILQQLPITDLIQLQSNKDVNNYTEFLYPYVLNSMPRHLFLDFKNKVPDYRLHIWESPIPQESSYQKQWKMSAKDTRYAIILTRLAAAFINDEEWLADCQPIGASLNEVKFVKLLGRRYEEKLIMKASNVNLVHLCHYTDDGSVMECFGIGIVRAIDYNIRRVFLVPAMPIGQLIYVNCLALGHIPLPSTLFTTQGPKIKNKARFVYNTLNAKASKAVQHFHCRRLHFPKNL